MKLIKILYPQNVALSVLKQSVLIITTGL